MEQYICMNQIKKLNLLYGRKTRKAFFIGGKFGRTGEAGNLFFWFAKRHQYDWLKHLNQNEIDLGSGKRMIAKNGSFDEEL